MSVSGPLDLPGTAPSVPFRAQQTFGLTASGGTTSDEAMVSLERLGLTPRLEGSALWQLRHNKNDQRVANKLSCPLHVCETEGAEWDFCVPNMTLVDLDVRATDPGGLEHDALRHEKVNLLAEEMGGRPTVEALIFWLTERGRPDDAATVFHAAAAAAPSRSYGPRLMPFQELFAKRVVLPRSSALAYWGVGVGKTAGAAAVLLQAGNAVQPIGGRIRKGQIPIVIYSTENMFGSAAMAAARFHTDRARDVYAVEFQLSFDINPPRVACRTYGESVPEAEELGRWADQQFAPGALTHPLAQHLLDSFADGLVVMNEAHLLTDQVYVLLKAVNLATMYGSGKLGFPPVIAALSGTPTAGGLRKFMMLLDILNSDVYAKGQRRQSSQLPGNFGFDGNLQLTETTLISAQATEDLIAWMGLTPYQSGRVGQRVVIPVHPETLGDKLHEHRLYTQAVLRVDVTTPLNKTAQWVWREGTVAQVRDPLNNGNLVLMVDLDPDDDVDARAPHRVAVPAVLSALPGMPPDMAGAVCSAMHPHEGGGWNCVLVTADSKNGQVTTPDEVDPVHIVKRPLTLVHSSAADMSFEEVVLGHFHSWGAVSYADLLSTGYFPTPEYMVVLATGPVGPLGANGLVNPVLMIRDAHAPMSNDAEPRAAEAWDLMRHLDKTMPQSGGGSHAFHAKGSDARKNYADAFYVLLLDQELGADTYNSLVAHGLVDKGAMSAKIRWSLLMTTAAAEMGLELRQFAQVVLSGIRPPKASQVVATASTMSVKFPNIGQVKVDPRHVKSATSGPPQPLICYVSYDAIPGLLAIFMLAGLDAHAIIRDAKGATTEWPAESTNQGQRLVLVSDVAGADEMHNFSPPENVGPQGAAIDNVQVGNNDDAADLEKRVWLRARQLIMYAVPPSRERMLQVEGRIRRNACDDQDVSTPATRTATYYLLCGDTGKGDADAVRRALANNVHSLGAKASARETGALSEREVDTVFDKLTRSNVGQQKGNKMDDFSKINFRQWGSNPDCMRYTELQGDISGYDVFFQSLAQQLDMNREVGDDLAAGDKTIQWIGRPKTPTPQEVVRFAERYLNTAQPRPPAEPPEPPPPNRMQQDQNPLDGPKQTKRERKRPREKPAPGEELEIRRAARPPTKPSTDDDLDFQYLSMLNHLVGGNEIRDIPGRLARAPGAAARRAMWNQLEHEYSDVIADRPDLEKYVDSIVRPPVGTWEQAMRRIHYQPVATDDRPGLQAWLGDQVTAQEKARDEQTIEAIRDLGFWTPREMQDRLDAATTRFERRRAWIEMEIEAERELSRDKRWPQVRSLMDRYRVQDYAATRPPPAQPTRPPASGYWDQPPSQQDVRADAALLTKFKIHPDLVRGVEQARTRGQRRVLFARMANQADATNHADISAALRQRYAEPTEAAAPTGPESLQGMQVDQGAFQRAVAEMPKRGRQQAGEHPSEQENAADVRDVTALARMDNYPNPEQAAAVVLSNAPTRAARFQMWHYLLAQYPRLNDYPEIMRRYADAQQVGRSKRR
jgi:hypothetical protein